MIVRRYMKSPLGILMLEGEEGLLQRITLCPDCASCPDSASCMNCAAVTYTETGRFDGKPEYMCRLNRAYRETIRKVAAELKKDL